MSNGSRETPEGYPIMKKIHALLALSTLVAAGAAQAQSCPCNPNATVLASASATQAVLSNKMVCGQVGSERWQEWHNGATSGPIVDYKLGPTHPVDPSSTVGSYAINTDGTVSYTYGSTTYRYAVCPTGGTYTFCGANFGGRNIAGVVVAANSGLQSCTAVASTASRSVRSSR
jgi:hypothetical protein